MSEITNDAPGEVSPVAPQGSQESEPQTGSLEELQAYASRIKTDLKESRQRCAQIYEKQMELDGRLAALAEEEVQIRQALVENDNDLVEALENSQTNEMAVVHLEARIRRKKMQLHQNHLNA